VIQDSFRRFVQFVMINKTSSSECYIMRLHREVDSDNNSVSGVRALTQVNIMIYMYNTAFRFLWPDKIIYWVCWLVETFEWKLISGLCKSNQSGYWTISLMYKVVHLEMTVKMLVCLQTCCKWMTSFKTCHGVSCYYVNKLLFSVLRQSVSCFGFICQLHIYLIKTHE
jgi:hypothetical protein